jgi:serine/threonine protein kinase
LSESKLRSEYKSPEILEGQNGNFKSDIWALGIITYEVTFINYSDALWKISLDCHKLKTAQSTHLKIKAQVSNR